MKDLIKISTNDKGQQLVSARELYEGLKYDIKRAYYLVDSSINFSINIDVLLDKLLFSDLHNSLYLSYTSFSNTTVINFCFSLLIPI